MPTDAARLPATSALAIVDRAPTYPDPIRLRPGDAVLVQRRDEDWPEFLWCVAVDGREGWVPQRVLEASELDASTARARAAYDARELAIAAGDVLALEGEAGGWWWARHADGGDDARAGWVRDEDLAPAPPGGRALIRPIAPGDAAAVAAVIRAVMPEFGADGPGFAIHDPEVDHMPDAYAAPGHAYFVLERGGRVVGGAGVAPLAGGEPGVCELRKMYFLPEARGIGAGEAMMARCLRAARDLGHARIYLETLTGMDAAQRLYERSGFQRLCAPLGATGHGGCDRWFARDL